MSLIGDPFLEGDWCVVETMSARSRRSRSSTLQAMRAVRFDFDGKEYPLVLPDGVYEPDVWTRVLVRGLLSRLAREPNVRTIVEVGVGSGIVPVILDYSNLVAPSLKYTGLDVKGEACEAARLNIQLNGVRFSTRLVSGGHLLDRLPVTMGGRVDILAANVPQVPCVNADDVNVNDYYSPQCRMTGAPGRFDQCGVGLLLDLIQSSHSVLSSVGALVLTVAGRCGWNELNRLFAFCGMNCEVLERRIVRQDPSTSIESFSAAEIVSDIRFVFYADKFGQKSISARAATQAVNRELPVYHDLYALALTRSATS